MSLIFSQIIIIRIIIFLRTNHPITLGFLLIFSSVIFSIIIFLISRTPWISFVLIIVFLRGSIVIFIYITSISSNEVISIEFKFLPIIVLLILILIINNNNPLYNNIKNLNPIKNLINRNSIEIIYKTYNNSLNFFTLFIIIYLLLIIIVAVKITISSKSPLRS